MKCEACGAEIPELAFCDQCGQKAKGSARETVVSSGPSSSKYEMLKEIGRGGMGIVYEGLNKQLGKHVAIKKMREEIAVNPREKKRFMDEAIKVAELHHPNIVDIYDIYEEGGSVYLVFEHIDGEPLDALLIRENRLQPAKAAEIALGVCGALDHAHSKKIIHRDIKPSNIMLARNGFVKVMDFGIAHQASETVSKLTGIETSGTFAYMSPEQHLGKYDARSDVYSLGVSMYEMVTGELPFNGPDYLAQKREMVHKKPGELVKDLPTILETAILDCLQCDVDKRPQAAADLAVRLKLVK